MGIIIKGDYGRKYPNEIKGTSRGFCNYNSDTRILYLSFLSNSRTLYVTHFFFNLKVIHKSLAQNMIQAKEQNVSLFHKVSNQSPNSFFIFRGCRIKEDNSIIIGFHNSLYYPFNYATVLFLFLKCIILDFYRNYKVRPRI